MTRTELERDMSDRPKSTESKPNAALLDLQREDLKANRAALRVCGATSNTGSGQTETCHGELESEISARVSSLTECGVAAGDRVALLGENSPDWVVACLSLWRIRATVIPLDPQLKERDLADRIDTTDPKAILADAKFFSQLAVPKGTSLISMSSGEVVSEPERVRPRFRPSSSQDRDPQLAAIVFTSGSTRHPKGVMLTRTNIGHALLGAVDGVDLDQDTDLLCVVPLHHVLGLCACMAAVLVGGTVTFVAEPRSDLLLKAMQETGTTVLPGPPRLFELILGGIESQVARSPAPVRWLVRGFRALTRTVRRTTGLNPGRVLFRKVHTRLGGRLKHLVLGGAAIRQSTYQDLMSYGFDILEGYGLTETSAGVSFNTKTHRRDGTVGRPLEGTEVRIAHPDVKGIGELWVRGPTVMRGYFRDLEATREILLEDGWLRTGDLASVDKDGYIRIVGRIKEMIITSAGKNVSPDEVEWSYSDLDFVEDLAAFGMPSESQAGEEVHAAVVVKATKLHEHVLQSLENRYESLPSYLRIQRVHFVPSIPKTSTLKVRRNVLKQQLEPGTEIDEVTETEADVPSDALEAILHVLGEMSVPKAGDFHEGSVLVFDVGLDSLGHLDLAARLQERLGQEISSADVQRCKTLGDVVALIERQGSGDFTRSGAPSSMDVPPVRPFPYRLLFFMTRTLARLLWGLRSRGAERLPPSTACVLCANHQTNIDGLFVANSLPWSFQSTFCVLAKKELLKSPFTRMVVRAARGIAVDRMGDVGAALEAGNKVLEAGRPLLVHPEGTRSRDGSLLPFRLGAAKLAIHAGVPLVPIRIEGGFEIFSRHRKLPDFFAFLKGRRKLRVSIGLPIHPKEGLSAKDLTDLLERSIADQDGGGPGNERFLR